MGDIEALCKRVVISIRGKRYMTENCRAKDKYAPEKNHNLLDSMEDKKAFAHLKPIKNLMGLE